MIQACGPPAVRANGKDDLLRLVYVESPTHSGLTIGESTAAVEMMMRRLDTRHLVGETVARPSGT